MPLLRSLSLLLAALPMMVQAATSPPSLLPWPAELEQTGGSLTVNLPFDPGIVRYESAGGLGQEHYRLFIDGDGIRVQHGGPAGAFYARQTLEQLLPPGDTAAQTWDLPRLEISDSPRFGWRGMHMDVSRHFMPVEGIKRFIDLIARYKFNRFHWHLTDDQGWRIEIKRYPRLTSVGACRDQTLVGHGRTPPDQQVFDGKRHCGFYTQDEIREVVAYAAERHVTVMPEIEFPGHAQAAIAAYPELGNTGDAVAVKQNWGISPSTVNPGEETLQFYRNVLDEVLELFPSEYIHIGGDEALKDQWEESEFAQRRMKELGLQSEEQLQSWLITRMDEYLAGKGRKLVGWDEILEGGLSPNATVMSWRGMDGGIEAARAGHDVVMAPTDWTYFDYYQGDEKTEPLAIGGYLPLDKVYRFDPLPSGLTPEQASHVLGAQAQLWSEYIPTSDHMDYMAFPRAIALAEVLWTGPGRDFADFQDRLDRHLPYLGAQGVNYRPLDGGAGPWTTLFDGTSLDAWRAYGGGDVPNAWMIEDGTLKLSGRGGDIITRARFSDFELELEWKISAGGNSGIFYLAETGLAEIYHGAPEMQVLDDDAHRDGADASTRAGALYGLYPATAGAVNPAGEWNRVRIVVDGGEVEHWLNGHKIVSCTIGSPDWQERVRNSKFNAWSEFGKSRTGHIGLQDHDDTVWFRDIRVRELR